MNKRVLVVAVGSLLALNLSSRPTCAQSLSNTVTATGTVFTPATPAIIATNFDASIDTGAQTSYSPSTNQATCYVNAEFGSDGLTDTSESGHGPKETVAAALSAATARCWGQVYLLCN
jgi:hypothetical protein